MGNVAATMFVANVSTWILTGAMAVNFIAGQRENTSIPIIQLPDIANILWKSKCHRYRSWGQDTITINRSVLDEIETTIGGYCDESGGILGGPTDTYISNYVFDCVGNSDTYVPSVVLLNRALEDWADSGVCFAGIVHSHKDRSKLSYIDISYARKVLSVNMIPSMNMFLYVLSEKKLYCFRISETEVSPVEVIVDI